MSAETDPWPKGVGRHILGQVDSTNAEALRLAAAGAGPAWVLAREQTAGRGRRARPWASPPGNFYGTLLLWPNEPPSLVALRSFAASLALRDAFISLTGAADPFSLKWPNDVLLNGGKVAGILLEASRITTGQQVLCIGIGVNLANAPTPAAVEEGALPPVCLSAETGVSVTPEQFLDALAPAYAAWEARLQTEGFAPLRKAWLVHAARLGQVIRARTGTMTRIGTFETIDHDGNLVLVTSEGQVAIPAAEVFF